MLDDDILLRHFVEEDAEEAFAELVRRHVDAVYSAALRRVGGDIHLAEDVTQQVFADLARRAAKLVNHPALGAWLHTATRHAAANVVRTERRRKAREQTATTMSNPAADPVATFDWTRLAPVIDAAIDHLAERDRAAVHLRFIENRSFAEIGATLGLSEDAARMRVDRALTKLRAALVHRGIASTASALGFALADHAVIAAPAGLAAQAVGHALAATAATTASSLAGFLHAMTTTKLTVAAGAILLLAAIGTASHEFHRRQAAELALASEQRDVAALADRLHALDARTAATARETATLQQKLHERLARQFTAATAVDSSSSHQSAPPRDPVAAGQAFMARHPAVRQALIDWLDAQINYKWSRFYETAGFTQDQIAAFQAILRGGSSIEFSDPPNLMFSADPQPPAEREPKLRALLGADGYQKYLAYAQSGLAREFGAQLAGALAFTPTPLTSDEFDQFTRALASNGGVKGSSTGPQYDWDAITAEAQAVLSPVQRTVLDALRAQAIFNQATNRVRSSAPTPGKPASDPAPAP